MALPSDLTLITVTGTYLNVTGAALTGQVNFSLTTPVQDATGKVILNAFTQPVPLNSNGSISIVLPCTDNANFSPANPSYLVTEQIPGLGRAYYIQLPHTLGATVDLSQLAPVTAPPVNTAFGTANTWTATQAYSGNPGLKITTGAAAGDVLTSDAAGNATWAAATGGITPPAGDIGGTTTAPAVVSTHLTDALPLTQGGTGQATQQAALDALAGATASGDYLRGNGTHVAMSPIQAGDLPAATTSTQGAVILDGTAADIQPAGVAAAGAKGQAADAKHVHPLQPWQFQPEAYGAKGDGKIIADAVLASDTTLTSATAGFTSAVNGMHIMINGGSGTTSGPLITTITFVSSTTVTLGAPATVSGTGFAAVYGTDDTAAINSAVSAAKAYALANQYFCEVMFAAKLYILASGPTQAVSPQTNAQVVIPWPDTSGVTQKLVVALTGAGDCGFYQFWESLTPNVTGTALVSMTTAPSSPSGTFGEQSVIGGPSAGGAFTGFFADTKVVVRGIEVVCGAYTNQYAYDFGYLTAMRVQQSSAHIFAPTGVGGGNLPVLNGLPVQVAFQSTIGTGLRCPVIGNNADIVVDDFTAEGYARGLYVFDHLTAGRVATIYNDVALIFDGTLGVSGTSHGIFISLLSAEVYNGGILAGGGTYCPVYINLDAECATVAYDISDSGNRLYGVVHWTDPADSRLPAVTGAANLKVINDKLGPGSWSGAPSVPASAAAQVNTSYRDATVYLTSGGAAVTAIKVDSVTTGLTLSTSGTVAVRVPSGHSITLTYASTAPTWAWVLD